MTRHLSAQTCKSVLNVSTAIGVVFAAAVVASCGRSTLQSASPLAPSPIGAAFSEAGAPESAMTGSFASRQHWPFHGPISSALGACPDRTFTVGAALKVFTSAATTYAGGNCAGLVDGAIVEVSGAVQADSRLLATRIVFDPAAITPPEVSLSGSIDAPIIGMCPAKTFVLGTNLVAADAATVYVGGACNGLIEDADVTVIGRRQADGRILATQITFDDHDDDDDSVPVGEIMVTGVVESFRGTCPTLTLVVSGHHVVTNVGTSFTSGNCREIVVGRRIAVRGAREANGTTVASRVEIKPMERGLEEQVEGAVVGPITGTCPLIGFTVATKNIVTTHRTAIRHGNCSDLQAGVLAKVRGVRDLDGKLHATEIDIHRRDHNDVKNDDAQVAGPGS